MFQFRAVTDFVASVTGRGTLTVSRLKRSLNKAANPIVFLTTYHTCYRSDVAGSFDEDASSSAPGTPRQLTPSLVPPESTHAVWMKLLAAREATACTKSSVSKATIMRAYRTACIHAGMSPFPPSWDSVSLSLVQLLMRNSGSCRSEASGLTRRFSNRNAHYWG